MAAREPYDDPGLPIAVASVEQTLTLQGRGGVAIRQASKRQKIYKSRDGISQGVVTFSGSNTEWTFSIPYNNLSVDNMGILFDYWFTYGNGAEETIYLDDSDGHTYVVRILSNYDEHWRGNLKSMTLLLAVVGKVAD